MERVRARRSAKTAVVDADCCTSLLYWVKAGCTETSFTDTRSIAADWPTAGHMIIGLARADF